MFTGLFYPKNYYHASGKKIKLMKGKRFMPKKKMCERTKMWILLWVGLVAVCGGAVVYALSDAPWTASGVVGLMLGFTCLLFAEIIYNEKRKSYSQRMRVFLLVSFSMEIVGLAALGIGRVLGWGFDDGKHLAFFIIVSVILFTGIIISTLVQVKAANLLKSKNALDAPRDAETEEACEKAAAEEEARVLAEAAAAKVKSDAEAKADAAAEARAKARANPMARTKTSKR